MKYHAPTDEFTISKKSLEMAVHNLLYSMRHIRAMDKLPQTKYEREGGQLSHADHAQKGIIDAAKEIGIDLGGDWGNEIDITPSS
jgi:hypothetical protein